MSRMQHGRQENLSLRHSLELEPPRSVETQERCSTSGIRRKFQLQNRNRLRFPEPANAGRYSRKAASASIRPRTGLGKVKKLGALKRPRRRQPANAKLQHRQFCTPLWCFLRSQLRSFIMYHKHQMILLRIFSLFAQAQLPMVEMLITCSVKRDFARLCRPLIPIASDPRQRLSTLKSDILILHSRKQIPLMQPLVLQFFQRRKMLLKCFHQRTIDFSV